MSVPKILTLFIPEILSRPAIAGKAKTLLCPRSVRPVGRREEDVRNAKASRSRDLLKAGHPKAEVARLAGVSLCSVKRIAEEAPVVHVDDAAEREKRRIGRPSIVEDFRKPVVKILEENPTYLSGDPSPGSGSRLPGRQDRLVRSGGFCSSERDKAADSFRRSARRIQPT